TAPQTPLLTDDPILDARLSPDETRIAFTSSRSGQFEVYVDTFPRALAHPQPIAASGGRFPRWRGDGRELYFVAGNGDLMAVAVPPASQAPLGSPARLFKLPAAARYTAAADGSRFLVLVQRSGGVPGINLVLNWAASLQQK